MATVNGLPKQSGSQQRSQEVADLIDAVKSLVIPFIEAADKSITTPDSTTAETVPAHRPVLVESHSPEELISRLKFNLPEHDGTGKDGLLDTIQKILQYSVNTWDQGFLDKLYSSTNAVGVVSELVLAVLNTNVHVYQVSPALTIIERVTGRSLGRLFGFNGPRAGGVTISGGSASNMSSVVIARNTLYPETKVNGNASHQFILFTSAHGHYSVEKAAQACGMGSSAVWSVPVDSTGRLIPSALRDLIVQAKDAGKTPLYVNTTAGTTVMGSFDLFEDISAICKEHGLWMHIDASWGGPVVFSSQQKHKLKGSHLADSLTVNPHKMMNVPMTCSFLLGPDLAIFHQANTLPAGYLFHGDTNGAGGSEEVQYWDLADLTLQCGRRGDSLKLALSWIYYGPTGFERQIDHAFRMAAYLAELVDNSSDFVLISTRPPPCLQVCFYFAPDGRLPDDPAINTKTTRTIVAELVHRGFMVDFAPGEKGSFFRVVVNWQTIQSTVEKLVATIKDLGTANKR